MRRSGSEPLERSFRELGGVVARCDTSHPAAPVAGDPVSDESNATEQLDVDVDQRRSWSPCKPSKRKRDSHSCPVRRPKPAAAAARRTGQPPCWTRSLDPARVNGQLRSLR